MIEQTTRQYPPGGLGFRQRPGQGLRPLRDPDAPSDDDGEEK
ncbi:hypothetical protein ACFC08_23170 [Streptomyces sp. NPDC056112]|nr:hypothetical protein [Streptomyces sp. CoT10]